MRKPQFWRHSEEALPPALPPERLIEERGVAVIASITDSSGHYSLTLTPGTYSILGGAFLPDGTPWPADQPTVIDVLSAGQVLNLNWTVTLPAMVSGTVTPAGPFPDGTTYRVIACPFHVLP